MAHNNMPGFIKRDLRILLLEDSLLDVYFIERELKIAGLSCQVIQVETEGELRRELDVARPDLILSDHGLPAFDGFTALDIVRKKSPDLPFIFVSGSNDQGMVLNMYEQGATDYVYKRELHELSLAVCRALTPTPKSPPNPPAPEEQEVTFPVEESPLELVAEPAPLLFCPRCLQARGASGSLVQMRDHLRKDVEILFLHEPCADCKLVSLPV